MLSEQEARDALRSWVTSKAKPEASGRIDDATLLFADRYLTSVHVPELLLLLERLRGAPIDPERLGPGDFRDINTIVRRFCTPAPGRLSRGDAMPEAPATEADPEPGLAAAGLRWHPRLGQSTLSGPLLCLAADCDRAFLILAGAFGAQEEQHPAAVSAELLHRLDYFSSFPHQATFPATLDGDEDNLAAFAADPFGQAGVRLARLAPVRAVLTPAACYHIYAAREGVELAGPAYVTTVATCFRREAAVEPLVRQWAFRMREVVCAGTAAEVRQFLARARELADRLCRELSLPITWETATDSFFRPLTNPKFLLQKVAPTKEEAVFGGRVAIGSVNLHHDHIGSAFGITRAGGAAHTGCLAFGLERWLYALSSQYGEDPASWPAVAAAASRAVAAGSRA